MRIEILVLWVAMRAGAQPATLAGFSDEGAFTLYCNEENVGRLTFQWKADGSFHSQMTILFAGQSVEGTLTITPDADGRWVRAVDEAMSKKWVWERHDKKLKFDLPEWKAEAEWPPESLTFESWSPPLVTQALRRFDPKGDRQQTLPVVVLDMRVPGDANLNVEQLDTLARTVNGKKLRLTRWVYAPPGHEYHVLADDDGRVYLMSGITGFPGGVSGRNNVFVREGYEALWEKPQEAGPISQASFEVELRAGTAVPMRDGAKLATDLYLPKGAAKAPVILIRTPYAKEIEGLSARYFARRGYAVAVQDVRGRFASEGVWEPFVHEARDGYDAIEWLARQPWSSGKVGMIGPSYLGWVQWWAASLHPPHLAAMIPNVSPPDPFHNIPFEGGSLGLAITLEWADRIETKATAEISGAKMAQLERKDYGTMLKTLPVKEIDKAVFGGERAWWRNWTAHPTPDDYWASTMFGGKLKDLAIPVFHQSGWFDGDGIGTKLNYLQMAAYGHKNQKLTIGPWEHTDTASQISMFRDFGPEAAIDLQRDYLRWFDHWLQGMDNGIEKEPAVSLFVMGSNRWLRGPTYPLPQTQYEKLYLSGGGRLSFRAPEEGQPADRYVYDPVDPTPADRLPQKERKDILVYTTEPFEKPYTFAGPLSAVLYAATSARDTDWFVHVLEIDEKGAASTLWANESAGHIRARNRNSLTKAELLEPGKIYRYEIDLWHTGVTIAVGHRLRVEVSSASFPAFERNLNTGGNNETEARFVTAEQTVYHDARHASYVLLPRIPD